jgi:hypothetical protein
MKTTTAVILGAWFVIALMTGNASPMSQTVSSDKLPTAFADLVPQGHKLVSARSTETGPAGVTMSAVTFVASKPFPNRYAVTSSEYRLNVTLMEKPLELVKMQERMYRLQLDKDIESSMKARTPGGPETTLDATVQREPPELKRYPWGAAITQKVTHKYMGAGKNPDEIEYSCKYLGLMVTGNVIRKFELTVSGVSTREEADRWAATAADKIGSISPNGLGR